MGVCGGRGRTTGADRLQAGVGGAGGGGQAQIVMSHKGRGLRGGRTGGHVKPSRCRAAWRLVVGLFILDSQTLHIICSASLQHIVCEGIYLRTYLHDLTVELRAKKNWFWIHQSFVTVIYSDSIFYRLCGFYGLFCGGPVNAPDLLYVFVCVFVRTIGP